MIINSTNIKIKNPQVEIDYINQMPEEIKKKYFEFKADYEEDIKNLFRKTKEIEYTDDEVLRILGELFVLRMLYSFKNNNREERFPQDLVGSLVNYLNNEVNTPTYNPSRTKITVDVDISFNPSANQIELWYGFSQYGGRQLWSFDSIVGQWIIRYYIKKDSEYMLSKNVDNTLRFPQSMWMKNIDKNFKFEN